MAPSKFFKKVINKLKAKKEHVREKTKNSKTKDSVHSFASSSTRQHPPIASQPQSLLLSLPGELRNKIYDYVTCPSLDSIAILAQFKSILAFPVFRISRQIRVEALSLLCSSKLFDLNGLITANRFFASVREHMPQLKRLIIRCDEEWWLPSEDCTRGRKNFLQYLELAKGLEKVTIVVGRFPLSEKCVAQLGDPSSVGMRFLCDARDTVLRVDAAERERATRERYSMLLGQGGLLHAIKALELELTEASVRGQNVFKVYRPTRLDGTTVELTLPAWMPDYTKEEIVNIGQ
ncbi:hypothetical protein B5807_01684 [Epicoccum nigrum]|uniref:F-box domain-containing protein n=1 Tax=Epicoccum nigrum TaxID=105696 RepID=A0A1Y2MDK7_EPING|nr:hypothetical protein B5807_01684 [Epicoccum nigrum]